jgi:predicted transposase/invertase (TIGR01784 family)
MNKERLNPLNDYMFLKIMGEKGDEEQLRSFLNAVLEREGRDVIRSVEIIENKKITAKIIGDKTSILDIRSITADDERTNIEVQLRNQGNMDRRSLFYWSREFSAGIKAGQDYHEAPNVIVINILDYEFMPAIPDFHLKFQIREDTHSFKLTDALEMHFISMAKFRSLPEKDIWNNKKLQWLTWLDKSTPISLVEKIIANNPEIKQAEEKMMHISMSKSARRAYEMREMAMCDWTTSQNHARREEKLEIARNFKNMGVPVEQIALGTGLSIEEIGRI